MLFCTLLGGYGLLCFIILIFIRTLGGGTENLKGGHASLCIAWKWGVFLLYPMAMIPFYLRYYRVRFVFTGVRQMRINNHPTLYFNSQPKRKSYLGESHIIRILAVILLFMAFVRVCFDQLLSNAQVTSDSCQQGPVLTSVMVLWVVIHCVELLAFLWVAVDSMRKVKRPEFSMTREMTMLAFPWGVITTCAATLMAIRVKRGASEVHDDDWYWRWNTACDFFYILTAATLGTTYPLAKSYISSGFSWYPLFGDCKVLRSLESILNNISALQLFRSFLIRECTVENLLLWVEIEIFKDDSTLRHAQRIYNKFLKNEPELEVTTVSDDLKAQVYSRITRARRLISDCSCIFDEVQKEIFEYMRRESYPRFLASPQSRMLMEILDHEELLCRSLIDSGMM